MNSLNQYSPVNTIPEIKCDFIWQSVFVFYVLIKADIFLNACVSMYCQFVRIFLSINGIREPFIIAIINIPLCCASGDFRAQQTTFNSA